MINELQTRDQAPFESDTLDRLLFAAFPGLVIRKDLTQEIRGTSKAPSYVIEFMLGKYCANLFDNEEVRQGLGFVHAEVAKYIPRGDETEVIKSKIREHSPYKLIDMIRVELDQSLADGVYWASLLTANIHKVNIAPQIVTKYERLLMAGVWSRVTMYYDEERRYRGKTFPFVIQRLDPIQESGQINRGTITVVGDASFVFNGNIEYDPRKGLLAKHLFKALPASVSDDMAFHDRWAAYLPGWELPKLTPDMFTRHVGFILDYTSELFHHELRRIGNYGTLWERWFEAPTSTWSARDLRSINRTFSGLTKLIFPTGVMEKADAQLLLDLAIELRLRVLLQLHTMNSQEFSTTELCYFDKETGVQHTIKITNEGGEQFEEI